MMIRLFSLSSNTLDEHGFIPRRDSGLDTRTCAGERSVISSKYSNMLPSGVIAKYMK